MSEYTVVVRARRWKGPPEQLHQLLAPVLGVSAEAAGAMLARGPVTVEADLSDAEARALCARLTAMGLPAEAMHEQALLNAIREDKAALASAQPPAQPATAARAPRVVSLFEEPSEADVGGWGEIFPELDAPPARQPPSASAPPARPLMTPRPTTMSTPAAPVAAASRAKAGPVALCEDADVAGLFGEFESSLDEPAATMQPIAPALSFGAEPVTPLTFGAEPAVEPKVPSAPPPQTPSRPVAPSPVAASAPRRGAASFDGGRIAEAVAARENAPPYTPQGYDDSAPHLPWLAAALSALAPGAGQVYNGQPERAMDYGLWFFMIKPWVAGVRQARRQAERIESYWAPKPPAGALLRALRWALGWYLVVGALVGVFGWAIVKAVERATREEIPLLTPEDVARVMEDARQHALEARIKGLDAALADVSSVRGPPIVDDKERAERLFLIGLQYCRAEQVELCEAMMQRVTQLVPGHRDAFRLQAWASVRAKGGERTPMPEVARKETLSEYELRQISADMDLPMPKAPPTPAPDETAPTPPAEAAPQP
jgi:hypothetical protein